MKIQCGMKRGLRRGAPSMSKGGWGTEDTTKEVIKRRKRGRRQQVSLSQKEVQPEPQSHHAGRRCDDRRSCAWR